MTLWQVDAAAVADHSQLAKRYRVISVRFIGTHRQYGKIDVQDI